MVFQELGRFALRGKVADLTAGSVIGASTIALAVRRCPPRISELPVAAR